MANAARYFDLVREGKDAYIHRLRFVETARRIGIKPTARLLVWSKGRAAHPLPAIGRQNPQ